MPALPLPKTSPTRYISFKHALNLRYPSEDTGEWHFESAFFGEPSKSRPIPVAGDGGIVDTNPSLGSLGVREMSGILKAQGVTGEQAPVFVANHYRAIADLGMLHLIENQIPTIANCRAINQWLDTEEQVKVLLNEYLLPLETQVTAENTEIFNQWIKTIRYE